MILHYSLAILNTNDNALSLLFFANAPMSDYNLINYLFHQNTGGRSFPLFNGSFLWKSDGLSGNITTNCAIYCTLHFTSKNFDTASFQCRKEYPLILHKYDLIFFQFPPNLHY